MKQYQRELLVPSFVTYKFIYCHLTSMFGSKNSTENINAIYERSLRVILNDYESTYLFILQKAPEITFY